MRENKGKNKIYAVDDASHGLGSCVPSAAVSARPGTALVGLVLAEWARPGAL